MQLALGMSLLGAAVAVNGGSMAADYSVCHSPVGAWGEYQVTGRIHLLRRVAMVGRESDGCWVEVQIRDAGRDNSPWVTTRLRVTNRGGREERVPQAVQVASFPPMLP